MSAFMKTCVWVSSMCQLSQSKKSWFQISAVDVFYWYPRRPQEISRARRAEKLLLSEIAFSKPRAPWDTNLDQNGFSVRSSVLRLTGGSLVGAGYGFGEILAAM